MSDTARLLKAIDEVLHYVWDPLGVAGMPGARDEYRDYMGKVLELALSDSQHALSEHLHHIETTAMGVFGDRSRCDEVAAIILEWKVSLLGDSTKTSESLDPV